MGAELPAAEALSTVNIAVSLRIFESSSGLAGTPAMFLIHRQERSRTAMERNPNGRDEMRPLRVPPARDVPKRILFVDDETKVLEGLRRMLYPLRNEWEMEFASGGVQALEILSQAQFDILVTDLRMPVMAGVELLARVLERHPGVVRLVLSGTADQALTLKTAGLAHQYLVKPCDAETLCARVEGAARLRVLLDDPGLRRVISQVQSLPSMPALYSKLLEMLRAPDASALEIGELIEQDLGMSAKILQMANSVVVGVNRRINTPSQAVLYLGVDSVRALALNDSAFSQFASAKLSGLAIEKLRQHSLRVGNLARYIAKSLSWPALMVDDAFVGGLLHDTGKLILASSYPEQYREVLIRAAESGEAIRLVELAIFGTTHAEVGGYLLWLWGLSDSIVEVASRHHAISLGSSVLPAPVAAVHIADALVNQRVGEDLDRECLRALGLLEKLPAWQNAMEKLSG